MAWMAMLSLIRIIFLTYLHESTKLGCLSACKLIMMTPLYCVMTLEMHQFHFSSILDNVLI